jgi:ribosome-binding protein aMBF1 (putative translation factor)
MGRRKKVVIKPGEPKYKTVIIGGPKLVFNKRRVRRPFAADAIYAYQQLNIEWLKAIVEAAKNERLKQRMSQATLAAVLKTSQSEVSAFENYCNNPTAEFLDRVIKALGLKIVIKIED